MAIEKEIPKDIKDYKPKLIGPFTTRQILCFTPAAILAVGVYWGLKNVLSSDIRLFLVTIIGVPFILLGTYSPYNMPLEKFIKMIFISTLLSPLHRKYKTERIFPNERQLQQTQKNVQKKRRKKKAADPLLNPYR